MTIVVSTFEEPTETPSPTDTATLPPDPTDLAERRRVAQPLIRV